MLGAGAGGHWLRAGWTVCRSDHSWEPEGWARVTVSRSSPQQWEAALQTNPQLPDKNKGEGAAPFPLSCCLLPPPSLLSSRTGILGPGHDHPGTLPASSMVLPVLHLHLMGLFKLQGQGFTGVHTHLRHRPPRETGQVRPGRLGAWGHLGGHPLPEEGGTWVAGVRSGDPAGYQCQALEAIGNTEGLITGSSSVVQPALQGGKGGARGPRLQLCLAWG